MSEKSPLGDLKLSDLKDVTADQVNLDLLMSFRVLTYTIDPGSIARLNSIYDRLSRTHVRMMNREAFQANGFAVGTVSVNEGATIARELERIGAVRSSQAKLMIPSEKIEVLSKFPLQNPEVFGYAGSANTSATMTLGPGFLGWVMSAEPDPRYRGSALVKIFPAFWQPGIEDIRLRMGLDPIDYHPITVGQVLVRVEERGIILLGPAREMSDTKTLDNKLFFLPGRKPKICFYIIICDSVGL